MIMPVEVLISIVKDWYEWLVSGLVHLLSNDPFRRTGLMPCTPIARHSGVAARAAISFPYEALFYDVIGLSAFSWLPLVAFCNFWVR